MGPKCGSVGDKYWCQPHMPNNLTLGRMLYQALVGITVRVTAHEFIAESVRDLIGGHLAGTSSSF
jgi:hypothetical protein